MSTHNDTKTETDYAALQEELELRYGPALAQDIIDQVKKAEQPAEIPDYMVVKAMSEATEVFRADTRIKIRNVKKLKSDPQSNVIDLEQERQMRELERMLALYFQCQHTFYSLYNKALDAYIEEMPGQRKYKKLEYIPEMYRAA